MLFDCLALSLFSWVSRSHLAPKMSKGPLSQINFLSPLVDLQLTCPSQGVKWEEVQKEARGAFYKLSRYKQAAVS